MTNDTEAKLKRAAGLYVKQEGERLLAESDEIRRQNLTHLLPRADKTVQGLLKGNIKLSRRKAAFGLITAAACILLVVRIAAPFSENAFSGGGGMSSGAAAPSAPAPAGAAGSPFAAADEAAEAGPEANQLQTENEADAASGNNFVSERYANALQKEPILVSDYPEAAFPLIVEDSSYTSIKNSIEEGYLPPAEAVRTEELVNRFIYEEPLVQKQDSPFLFYTETGPSPFDQDKRLGLIRVGTKQTGASDVKAYVLFNPETVRSYRLIGYENSMPGKEELNNGIKNGEEIGPGLDVIVLLEFEPKEFDKAASSVGHFFTVRISYKNPGESRGNLIEIPVSASFRVPNSSDFGFASAVAMFGDYLKDPGGKGRDSVSRIIELAGKNTGGDSGGYRKDFVRLLNELAEL